MEAVMIKTIKTVKKERSQWTRTSHQLIQDHPNMAVVLKTIQNQLNQKMKINTATINLFGQPIKTMDLNHLLEASENDLSLIILDDLLHF